MFNSITFSVGKKTISLYGQEFVLGELSVQVTNIWYYQTREMYDLLKEGKNFILIRISIHASPMNGIATVISTITPNSPKALLPI